MLADSENEMQPTSDFIYRIRFHHIFIVSMHQLVSYLSNVLCNLWHSKATCFFFQKELLRTTSCLDNKDKHAIEFPHLGYKYGFCSQMRTLLFINLINSYSTCECCTQLYSIVHYCIVTKL